MSVWLTIPSARPPAQANPVLQKWRDQGYKIALWRDWGADSAISDVSIYLDYPGYAKAVNGLIGMVLGAPLSPDAPKWADTDAEWFVIGGDDVLPDPTKRADEIAWECSDHFRKWGRFEGTIGADAFGVMQPTGDRWGTNPTHPNPAMRTAYIDRICGSAWIGRGFARRVYNGAGPLWPEYQHMFVDEELQRVAEKLGVLWQRRDLTHHHQHYARNDGLTHSHGRRPVKPAHLVKWTDPKHWKEAETIFKRREAEGFKEAFVLA